MKALNSKKKDSIDRPYELQKYLPKKPPVRQFYVEEHRKEIDDYMIKSIKKNKKSIKHMQKEISLLKEKMQYIQNNKKEVFLRQKHKKSLGKNVNSDREHTVRYGSTQKNVYYNSKGAEKQKIKSIRKQLVKCKQSNKSSSVSSRNSDSNYSLESSKTTLKLQQRKNSKFGAHSKVLLSRKIEELKRQAKIDVDQQMKIKTQTINKIKSKSLEPSGKLKKNENKINKLQDNRQQNYTHLLNLLSSTSKSIQKPQNSPTNIQNPLDYADLQSKIRKQVQEKVRKQIQARLQRERRQELSISIQNGINYFNSQQNLRETIRSNKDLIDTANFNSQNINNQPRSHNNYLSSKTQHGLNQSNLLDSQIKFSLTSKRSIDEVVNGKKMSGIGGTKRQIEEAQEATNYPLFQPFQKEMSQNLENQEQRLTHKLKEYEFQFDQLIRQEILASSPTETQLIKNSIHNVLTQINDLKDRLQQRK